MKYSRRLAANIYPGLQATTLPAGTFDGRVLLRKVWPFWQGKVFTGDCVVNRMFWLRLVRGKVSLEQGEVVIRYRWLTDYLKPVSETLWLGKVTIWGFTVWFTLEHR